MKYSSPSLLDLEEAILKDFSYLNYPADNWVKPVSDAENSPVLDVAIIGAGTCGLAAWFGLTKDGIRNIAIFDDSDAGREGPWVTTARMKTLRSPKHLTGPNMGLPNLTFRAWFEAVFGAEHWEGLDKISRDMWMAYLKWYRKILEIPVQNNVKLISIKPAGPYFKLRFQGPDEESSVKARHVILATGRAAFGGVRLPQFATSLPGDRYAHTEDTIDFGELAGKNITVIGGAASAVDNAATALEAGADQVHMLMRAPDVPRLNKFKSITYPGFLMGFSSLDKLMRWRFLKHGFDTKIAAPRDSMLRLKAHENFFLHMGSPILDVHIKGPDIILRTPKGKHRADFVIFGTGYAIDIKGQPELAEFAKDILLWRDCFTPPPGEEDDTLQNYPLLGDGFEFREKVPGVAPYLERLHLFNAASTLTHAPISSDIPGINIGVSRLVNHLAKALFKEGAEKHLEEFYAYSEPELLGDEWD